MKVITMKEYRDAECHPDFSWHFGEASPKRPWIFKASDLFVSFNFEVNSPRRKDDLILLCDDFRELFSNFTTAYLLISKPEFFVPSGLTLVDAIRRGHGELRTIEEAPGHIFSADEADLLWGFYYLMVQMDWSFHITFPQYPCAIGHSCPGEHYFIAWRTPELHRRAADILKDFYPEFPREPSSA